MKFHISDIKPQPFSSNALRYDRNIAIIFLNIYNSAIFMHHNIAIKMFLLVSYVRGHENNSTKHFTFYNKYFFNILG